MSSSDENVNVIKEPTTRVEKIDTHLHLDPTIQNVPLLEDKPSKYDIYVGKSLRARKLVESFNTLKKCKNFPSNEELLAWLMRVGEMTIKEIDKRDGIEPMNEVIHEEQYNVFNHIDEDCNQQGVLCVGNHVSFNSLTSFSTHGGKYMFVPFQRNMLKNNQTPSLFVMRTNKSIDREFDLSNSSDALHQSNTTLTELTSPYIMHRDECVYNQYTKFLQQNGTKVPAASHRMRKRKKNSTNTDEAEINEEDFQRIAEQTKLKNHFMLKEGVLTAIEKLPFAPSVFKKCNPTLPLLEDEVDLTSVTPAKKSIYIVTKDQAGKRNVLVSAHSDSPREMLNNIMPIHINNEEENTKEPIIKIVKEPIIKIVKNKTKGRNASN